jgi:hypothetical protein
MSNAGKGAYYKARTRKWLEARGYAVADLEIVRTVLLPGRKPFPVKRDQLGSDLLAVRGDKIVFVQVKGGAQCEGKGQFLPAQREFNKFQFPRFVGRVIVAWAPGARGPRFVSVPHGDVTNGQVKEGRRTEEKGTGRHQRKEVRKVRTVTIRLAG